MGAAGLTVTLEAGMHLIIYGDFNCPYSYLASQRADTLARAGRAGVEWRAVEHDRGLPLTGLPSGLGAQTWEREVAEVAGLVMPGEKPPDGVPSMISNTGAAVAAYAEAVTDGVADELRRRLFEEIWLRHRHLGSPYEVRKLVGAVMEPLLSPVMDPPGLPGPFMAAPDHVSWANRHPDIRRLPRLAGCTIAPDGGPLTTTGYQRIRQWRQEWLAMPERVVPALVLPGGDTVSGVPALKHLAGLCAAGPAPTSPPS